MMGIPFGAAVAVVATRADDNIFPNICSHQIYNKTIKYAMNIFGGNAHTEPEPAAYRRFVLGKYLCIMSLFT